MIVNLIFRIICTVALLSSPFTYAASVTYDFSGSISYANSNLSPSISRGEDFFGSFSVNGTDRAARRHRDIINGSISVGGLDYQFVDYDLYLQDSSYQDNYWIFNGAFGNGGISGPSIGGYAVSSVQFIFSDWRGPDGSFWSRPDGVNGLTSSQLLYLSLFDSARVVFKFGRQLAKGRIDSLAITPLPAAAWLFFTGLAGLFGGKMVRRLKLRANLL